MEHEYSLENMLKEFKSHAEIAQSQQEFCNKMFLEQNPGQELPKHMADPFNVAKAFSVICEELVELKKNCK